LRNDAVEPTRARAVARVRSHGLSPRRPRSGEFRQSAGCRAERAAPERREPAVRHRRRGDVSHALPEDPSVLRGRHRLARRNSRGEAGRREEFLQDVLRAQQREPVIVGDIDKAAVKTLVEKYFGPFKKGPAVPKPSAETPKITVERRV